jgi:hypothetical protein
MMMQDTKMDWLTMFFSDDALVLSPEESLTGILSNLVKHVVEADLTSGMAA